jgi:hypothetical protein
MGSQGQVHGQDGIFHQRRFREHGPELLWVRSNAPPFFPEGSGSFFFNVSGTHSKRGRTTGVTQFQEEVGHITEKLVDGK